MFNYPFTKWLSRALTEVYQQRTKFCYYGVLSINQYPTHFWINVNLGQLNKKSEEKR